MKKLSLHIILILFSFNLFAQNPEIKRTWHWYFGYEAGIDFSSGNPIADINATMYSTEGCAAISDTAGNLLFYTNSDTVWNANHNIIQNGTGIMGCNSSSQGALILPGPGSDSIFYLFTTDCAENNLANGLRYSIIDIALDGGLGAITTKNVLLHTPVAEKLTAVKHYNGIDYWVITHEWGTDSFYVYLFTSAGIDTIPVISSTGITHSGSIWNSGGYLKASPNGKSLAAAIYQIAMVELFDFNDTTGIVSNPIILSPDSSDYNVYGISFSPDNSKLYVTASNSLYQFDLDAGTFIDIINSKTLISTYYLGGYGGLQIAPDGKIYVTRNNLPDSVGVINNPNALGLACNFIQNGIYLGGKICWGGLPNFVDSYFNDKTSVNGFIEENYNFNEIQIHPNPTNDYIYIELNDFINEHNISLKVFNLLGEIVITQDNIINKHLSLHDLPDGIYLIKIQTNKKHITKRIIVKK